MIYLLSIVLVVLVALWLVGHAVVFGGLAGFLVALIIVLLLLGVLELPFRRRGGPPL